MSPSQEALETADSARLCTCQSRGRDSSSSDATRSSCDYQCETNQLGCRRAAAFLNRVREFMSRYCNGISNQGRFAVASDPAHEPRTKFGASRVRWAKQLEIADESGLSLETVKKHLH